MPTISSMYLSWWKTLRSWKILVNCHSHLSKCKTRLKGNLNGQKKLSLPLFIINATSSIMSSDAKFPYKQERDLVFWCNYLKYMVLGKGEMALKGENLISWDQVLENYLPLNPLEESAYWRNGSPQILFHALLYVHTDTIWCLVVNVV